MCLIRCGYNFGIEFAMKLAPKEISIQMGRQPCTRASSTILLLPKHMQCQGLCFESVTYFTLSPYWPLAE